MVKEMNMPSYQIRIRDGQNVAAYRPNNQRLNLLPGKTYLAEVAAVAGLGHPVRPNLEQALVFRNADAAGDDMYLLWREYNFELLNFPEPSIGGPFEINVAPEVP